MNKTYIVLFFMLLACSELQAQNKGPERLSIGYMGETLTHPGLKVGLPILLKYSSKEKSKSRKTVNKIKSFYIVPQIGFYRHKQNHSSLIVNADLSFRRNRAESKWAHVYSIGIGTLTQFNAGTTYVHEEDGGVIEKSTASRTYFNPSLAYELNRQINESLFLYGKATMGFKVPYNTFVSLSPLIEIGVHVLLKNQ